MIAERTSIRLPLVTAMRGRIVVGALLCWLLAGCGRNPLDYRATTPSSSAVEVRASTSTATTAPISDACTPFRKNVELAAVPGAKAEVTPDSVRPGDPLAVTVSGFPASTRLTIFVGVPGTDGKSLVSVSPTADSAGNAQFTFPFPDVGPSARPACRVVIVVPVGLDVGAAAAVVAR